MKNYLINLVIAFVLMLQIISCVDRETEESKKQISSVIRQLNLLYREFDNEESIESNFKLNQLNSHFTRLNQELKAFRNAIYKPHLVSKHTILRDLMDTLVDENMNLLSNRYNIYYTYMEMFQFQPSQSKILRKKELSFRLRLGHSLADRVAKEADHMEITFLNHFFSISKRVEAYDSLSLSVMHLCDIINNKASLLDIEEKVVARDFLIDSTDYFHSMLYVVLDLSP